MKSIKNGRDTQRWFRTSDVTLLCVKHCLCLRTETEASDVTHTRVGSGARQVPQTRGLRARVCD